MSSTETKLSRPYKVYCSIENNLGWQNMSINAKSYQTFLSELHRNLPNANIIKKMCYQNACGRVVTISSESDFKHFQEQNGKCVLVSASPKVLLPTNGQVLAGAQVSSNIQKSCESAANSFEKMTNSLVSVARSLATIEHLLRSKISLTNEKRVPRENVGKNEELVTEIPKNDVAQDSTSFHNEMDINAKDKNGATALHHATMEGELRIAEYLVGIGANINAKNSNGCTALHLASKYGKLDVAKMLVQNGIDINCRDASNFGYTALDQAILYGYSNIVKCLVENKADINAKNKFGWNALHFACTRGNLDIIEFLVENGCEISAKDNSGQTALHIASSNGYQTVIDYLENKLE